MISVLEWFPRRRRTLFRTAAIMGRPDKPGDDDQ
jgi:hypothetical protein